MPQTTLFNPFSKEGAAKLSQYTGQKLAPESIDASVLGSTPTVNIPQLPQTPLPDYTKIAPSTPPITEIKNTAEQDRLATERTGLINDVTAGNTRLGTRSARQMELEAQQGIPEQRKQLNELYSQIRTIQSEAFTATQKSEDRLAPTFAIQGEQAKIERQRAVRVYGFAAAAEALQGNIALAEDHVTRALDAEFGPLEKEIENKKFLLEVNMDNFSTEEKRRAEAQQVALNQQQEQINQAKAEKQNIMTAMLAAAEGGADNLTLKRIQEATTYAEAVQIAAPFVKSSEYVSQGTYQDGNGNQYFYGVKPDGTVENIPLAGAPKSPSGGSRSGNLVYTESDRAEDAQALEASRGGDGWVDPNVYLKLYQAWVANGGLVDDFIKKFPPKLYVNPANTWLPPFLRNTASQSADDAIDAAINSALSQ